MLMRPLARRPVGRGGLIGTAARTAVVAGTASAVAGGVQRRQQDRAAQAAQASASAPQTAPPPPTAAPPSPPPTSDPTISELERLADMQANGLLTQEEFAAAKAKLLGLD
ncbi:MAG TPA: SHOCT domain-containing protein [Acidimicrobiales bacterium]|nr:SHOCT domain-containing protein [Acidimicrobiales bacterium]